MEEQQARRQAAVSGVATHLEKGLVAEVSQRVHRFGQHGA